MTIPSHFPKTLDFQLRCGLNHEERARFLEIISAEHSDNPFKTNFLKHRNELICQTLFCLGLSRSEILSIKTSDIDWREYDYGSFPKIMNHTYLPIDTRGSVTEFIVRGHHHPIGPNLTRILNNYLQYRNKRFYADDHNFLFVNRDGSPLSSGTLINVFCLLRKISGLPKNLSAQLLRYTWNDLFSEHADQKIASGKWDIEDEKEIRRWCQGFSKSSIIPDKYARRHIETRALAICDYDLQESFDKAMM